MTDIDRVTQVLDREGEIRLSKLGWFPYIATAAWGAIEVWRDEGRQMTIVPEHNGIGVYEVDR